MSERHTYTSAVGDCTITGAIITTDSFFFHLSFYQQAYRGKRGLLRQQAGVPDIILISICIALHCIAFREGEERASGQRAFFVLF